MPPLKKIYTQNMNHENSHHRDKYARTTVGAKKGTKLPPRPLNKRGGGNNIQGIGSGTTNTTQATNATASGIGGSGKKDRSASGSKKQALINAISAQQHTEQPVI